LTARPRPAMTGIINRLTGLVSFRIAVPILLTGWEMISDLKTPSPAPANFAERSERCCLTALRKSVSECLAWAAQIMQGRCPPEDRMPMPVPSHKLGPAELERKAKSRGVSLSVPIPLQPAASTEHMPHIACTWIQTLPSAGRRAASLQTPK
jgi:hypothetical protein